MLEHWLLLIKQNLELFGWKDNAEKQFSIGPVIEKQVTISELFTTIIEEKFDA